MDNDNRTRFIITPRLPDGEMMVFAFKTKQAEDAQELHLIPTKTCRKHLHEHEQTTKYLRALIAGYGGTKVPETDIESHKKNAAKFFESNEEYGTLIVSEREDFDMNTRTYNHTLSHTRRLVLLSFIVAFVIGLSIGMLHGLEKPAQTEVQKAYGSNAVEVRFRHHVSGEDCRMVYDKVTSVTYLLECE